MANESLQYLMKRLLILGDPEHWHTQQLAGAHSRSFENVAVHSFESIRASIKDGKCHTFVAGTPLRESDTVIVRQMPRGSLQQIIFRMNALHAAESCGTQVINRASSLELAIDKFHLFAKLSLHDIPLIPTFVSQTLLQAKQDFQSLQRLSVIKPIFGGRGQRIERADDERVAEEYFQNSLEAEGVVYQQAFIDHPGWDLRVFAIGEKLFAIRRINPHDWRTNISLGAKAEPYLLSERESQLCQQVLKIVGAEMLGIDLIYDRDGQLYLIEVNGVPGWKGLQDCLGVNIAKEIHLHLAEAIRA